MEFGELIKGLEIIRSAGDLGKEIKGVAYDSRLLEEGEVFVAIRGTRWDGHDFIEEAMKKGASGLILEREPPGGLPVPWVQVPSSRRALARISCRLFSHPSLSLRVVGVTGTNGKTTTTYLLESILKEAGREVGVVGTINYRYRGKEVPAPVTTPESYDLQKILREMVSEGVQDLVMEVSSHALEQGRVEGSHFDGAIFTNLSHDHLDYHGEMSRYFEAKRRLFTEVLTESRKGDRWMTYNVEDPWGQRLAEGVSGMRKLPFGIKRGEVRTLRYSLSLRGFEAEVITPEGPFSLRSSLLGRHNLYNVLASVSAAILLGVEIEAIRRGVEGLRAVPGRMERVDDGEGPSVFVDYAHTPDALRSVLEGVRRLTKGKVIVVFGCGGERDREKRPLMGEVAASLGHKVIITSDNPRGEDPYEIIHQIEEGCRRAGGDWIVLPDRREAIRKAVAMAKEEDVVIIAGKGHEAYQIWGDKRVPFDDREEAKRALEGR